MYKISLFANFAIAMSITKSSNIDFSKVTFSDVRKMGKGKMVYANLNGGKIIIQTPKMGVPFGVSRWRDDNADDNNATMTVLHIR